MVRTRLKTKTQLHEEGGKSDRKRRKGNESTMEGAESGAKGNKKMLTTQQPARNRGG